MRMSCWCVPCSRIRPSCSHTILAQLLTKLANPNICMPQRRVAMLLQPACPAWTAAALKEGAGILVCGRKSCTICMNSVPLPGTSVDQ